jgi:predicted Zn-dependent protease
MNHFVSKRYLARYRQSSQALPSIPPRPSFSSFKLNNKRKWLLVTSALYFAYAHDFAPFTNRLRVQAFTLQQEDWLTKRAKPIKVFGNNIPSASPVSQATTALLTLINFPPTLMRLRVQVVVQESTQVNCAAVLGGKILVTTSMLDVCALSKLLNLVDETSLALLRIFAHEMGHLVPRHSSEILSRLPLVITTAFVYELIPFS